MKTSTSFLTVVALGAFGLLEWVVCTIGLICVDGLFCEWMDSRNQPPRPEIMSVQEAIERSENTFHSGIFTDYISIDISIAWLIGIIIYELYKKVK